MTEQSRESRWWHCVSCGNTVFTHKPTGICGQCAGTDWRTGKAKPVITIEDGKLVCPHCGGNDFTMVESGYSRFDSVRVEENKLLLHFFEMSDDGSGDLKLFCDNPKCTEDREELGFAVPEGLEIDYE